MRSSLGACATPSDRPSTPSKLVFACGAFALATSLGCGAAPASVCGHMQGLARAESSVGEELEFPLEQCTKTLETQRERLGAAAWATKASCMLSAESLVAVDAC